MDDGKDEKCSGDDYVQPGNRDIQVQLVITLTLGISAFVAFCILRPRWKTLYAARKRQLDPAIGLPALPDSFLGWIPALYKVTEEQVLASAGLDAFVFLSFFKMAIRLFSIMFFFAAVVLAPINYHFIPDERWNLTSTYEGDWFVLPEWALRSNDEVWTRDSLDSLRKPGKALPENLDYMWAYLVFTYLFTSLTIYIMGKETSKVLRIRQDYLGTQSTITDRTFRLSGLPKELKTESKIKALVEGLEIGQVESVTLCRNWKELDDLIDKRDAMLRKLEETWSVFLGQKPLQPSGSAPEIHAGAGRGNGTSNGDDIEQAESGENGPLLGDQSGGHLVERERPQARLWYGFLRLQNRKTDAIDYYEEKVRRLDEKIHAARKKEYKPADLAFVTMDSIAACQMAIQALIDPRPGQLQTKPAPAPSDVVWRNTYSPYWNRRIRSYFVTIFVAVLSIVWLIPVAFIASLLSLCTIRKVYPSFADSLEKHEITLALVQTGLPTLVVSLLNIAVPYLYEYLSENQGMLSRGDIALSTVSKNFFFTFFNIFFVFTVSGTATNLVPALLEGLRDTTSIMHALAQNIQNLSVFYLNFIMLQGIGLFPFRLLEIGSVALWPIYRMGAKTPRDFAQMVLPPVFSYGFYLPTALLVFILCLIYSVFPRGYLVLLLGIIYFALGHLTFKYQLLYAMDQPQHATGGAWRLICYRVLLGLFVLQLTMSGVFAFSSAFAEALLVLPLILGTFWYSYYFKNRFEPLTRFISLRSIRRAEDPDGNNVLDDDFGEVGSRRERLRRGSTIDEDREKGLRFLNPNLVVPLEQPWIYKNPPSPLTDDSAIDDDGNAGSSGRESTPREGDNSAGRNAEPSSNSSSFSLGDTHIWRENEDHRAT